MEASDPPAALTLSKASPFGLFSLAFLAPSVIPSCSLSPPKCYVFFIPFTNVCLQLCILLLRVAVKCLLTLQALSSAASIASRGFGAGEPVLTPFFVALLPFITSCATDVSHAGVHDSQITLALVGTGGVRIPALGPQPRGSTIRRRPSDITAANSSLLSFFFFLSSLIIFL